GPTFIVAIRYAQNPSRLVLLPPAGSLALTPNSLTRLNIGKTITGQIKVLDGSGSPVLNSPLSITVTGANPQQLTAITDNTGVASFSYQGVNTGDDRAQATMFMA